MDSPTQPFMQRARHFLSALATRPVQVRRVTPLRVGWPPIAAVAVAVASCRPAVAPRWSPAGPAGEWRRRSLDRYAPARRR
jgi:hypothetical protein